MPAHGRSTAWVARIYDKQGRHLDTFEVEGPFNADFFLDEVCRLLHERDFDTNEEFRVRMQEKDSGSGFWMIVAGPALELEAKKEK